MIPGLCKYILLLFLKKQNEKNISKYSLVVAWSNDDDVNNSSILL